MRLPKSRRALVRYVGIGSAAAVAAGVVVVAYGANAATESLLSQNRPVSASSVETAKLGPTNAVDGSTSTRWGSAEGSDPQWIAVDLGATSAVTRVNLKWETAYAKAYQIQVSDDQKTWRTIATTTTGDGGTDNLTGLSGSGRYVRMYGTARATGWGYSLWEMRVYGPSGASAAQSSGSGSGGSGSSGSSSGSRLDLTDAHLKDIAMQLVSSAENSSLDWRAQYKYIEDIGDGRGYTAGIVGFCSGTGDMLEVVQRYTTLSPSNGLAKYLPALRAVNGSDSHSGLDGFPAAWKAAATDALFQQAQDAERDAVYFTPAVSQAKTDGLRALGQFIYYDAIVMHGPGDDAVSFGGIRKAAMKKAKTPAQGGDEVTYLGAFLDARAAAMRTEEAHSDTSRVDTEQRVFLTNRNLDLSPPLSWKVYGDPYTISS
jgi:chitosanase